MVFSSSHKKCSLSSSRNKSSLKRKFGIATKGAIALGLFAGLATVSVPNVSEAEPRKVTARSFLRKATNAVVHGKTRAFRNIKIGNCLKLASGSLRYQPPHMSDGSRATKVIAGMSSCRSDRRLTASVAKTFKTKVVMRNGRKGLEVLKQGPQFKFGRAEEILALGDNLDGILGSLVADLDLGALNSEGALMIGAGVDTASPDVLQLGVDPSGLLPADEVIELDALGDLDAALSSLDIPQDSATTVAGGAPLTDFLDNSATDPFDQISDLSTSNNAPALCP